MHGVGGRGGAVELDGEVGGDGGRRDVQVVALHEVPDGRPVGVTVQERANDATVEHPTHGFVVLLGLPLGDTSTLEDD